MSPSSDPPLVTWQPTQGRVDNTRLLTPLSPASSHRSTSPRSRCRSPTQSRTDTYRPDYKIDTYRPDYSRIRNRDYDVRGGDRSGRAVARRRSASPSPHKRRDTSSPERRNQQNQTASDHGVRDQSVAVMMPAAPAPLTSAVLTSPVQFSTPSGDYEDGQIPEIVLVDVSMEKEHIEQRRSNDEPMSHQEPEEDDIFYDTAQPQLIPGEAHAVDAREGVVEDLTAKLVLVYETFASASEAIKERDGRQKELQTLLRILETYGPSAAARVSAGMSRSLQQDHIAGVKDEAQIADERSQACINDRNAAFHDFLISFACEVKDETAADWKRHMAAAENEMKHLWAQQKQLKPYLDHRRAREKELEAELKETKNRLGKLEDIVKKLCAGTPRITVSQTSVLATASVLRVGGAGVLEEKLHD